MRKRVKGEQAETETGAESEGEESSHSSSQFAGSSSSSDESVCDSDVEVTFTCYNMDKRDFHTVKQFLQTSFGTGIISLRGGEGSLRRVNTQQLAEIIVDLLGEYVGTTAKSAEDDDPLAIATMIPLRLEGRLEGATEEIQSHLDELADTLLNTIRQAGPSLSKKERAKLLSALEDYEKVALILLERFMNLPAEMAAPLYQQLLDDLPAATEESSAFAPEHVIVLAPIYREVASALDWKGEDKHESTKRKAKKQMSTPADISMDNDNACVDPEEYQYYYGECELLANEAIAWWDFKIKSPHETADSRRAFGDRGVDAARRVFLLPMAAFRSFVKQCQSLV